MLLAIPLLTAFPVQAKKTIDVYYRTPGVDPPTRAFISEIPGDVNKVSGDGHMLIRSGTFRTGAYGSEVDDRGPLGFGTGTRETIISISYFEILPPVPGMAGSAAHGHGIYKVTLDIEGGPYGAGTLSGTARLEWEWDCTDPSPLNWRYEIWGSTSFKQGTGDFAGVKVYVENYASILPPPPSGMYHTKTTVVSPS